MAETHHFHAHKLFGVKDFVCVVTGGGTGIGLMAAQALAANGAKVVRRPAQQQQQQQQQQQLVIRFPKRWENGRGSLSAP